MNASPSVWTLPKQIRLTALARLTGKLLWLSSLFRCFRPSLAPLYADQHSFTPVLTAVSPDVWQRLCDNVDRNLALLKSVGIAASCSLAPWL